RGQRRGDHVGVCGSGMLVGRLGLPTMLRDGQKLGQTRQLATKWSEASSSFPGMKAVVGRGALGALLVCAALAAPAQATIRQGAGSDPAGDSTGGAGTDITAVAGKADDSGAAAVAVQTS